MDTVDRGVFVIERIIVGFILPIVIGGAWAWFWFSCAEGAYGGGEIFDVVMGVLGIIGCFWWMIASFSAAQRERAEQIRREEQERENRRESEERRIAAEERKKERAKKEEQEKIAFNTCDKCGKKDAMVYKDLKVEESKVMKYVKPRRNEFFDPHYVYGDEIVSTEIYECKNCGAQKTKQSKYWRWDDDDHHNFTSFRKVN